MRIALEKRGILRKFTCAKYSLWKKQNFEQNLEKKEYDEKYERLLNQLEKENFF